jgi:PE-PPE domain
VPWITSLTGAAPPPPVSVVQYPASLWPISSGGLSDPTFGQSVAAGVAALPSPDSVQPGTVFSGGSQGSVVLSMYKRQFNQAWASNPEDAPAITLVLVENPMRPNGGILERLKPLRKLPILDIPFYGATPTQTAGAAQGDITTYDVAFQYNLFPDFPTNPLFILSVIDSLVLVPAADPANIPDAVLQDEYGDTAYYMVPTYPVPILMPLNRIPKVGPVLADTLDPTVRLLVEAGYDRAISPGQPTKVELSYFPNPITLARNLLISIPTGLDNGVEDIRGVRPFGTERPDVMGQGAYGINTVPVTMTPTTNEQRAATTVSVPEPPKRARKASTSTSVATASTRPKVRDLTGSDRLPKKLTLPSPRSQVHKSLHEGNDRRPLHRHLTGRDSRR